MCGRNWLGSGMRPEKSANYHESQPPAAPYVATRRGCAGPLAEEIMTNDIASMVLTPATTDVAQDVIFTMNLCHPPLPIGFIVWTACAILMPVCLCRVLRPALEVDPAWPGFILATTHHNASCPGCGHGHNDRVSLQGSTHPVHCGNDAIRRSPAGDDKHRSVACMQGVVAWHPFSGILHRVSA